MCLSFHPSSHVCLSACPSVHQVCDDYDVQQKEFYFDRNPGLFPYLLHFYQTGKLHIMEDLCVFSFRYKHPSLFEGLNMTEVILLWPYVDLLNWANVHL